MVLLEMNHVKKSFDGNGVLKDISLKVNEGEVVSIIGPSGENGRWLADLFRADGSFGENG